MLLQQQIEAIQNDYNEIKETQIIQLQAQAEIYERLQADIAIIFEALAEIYEKEGVKNNG